MGINIERTKDGIRLHQKDYVNDVLNKFNMSDCNGVTTPLAPGTQRDENSEEMKFKYPYREVIGNLQYLSSKSRPDICYATNYCARFPEPKMSDVKNVKHILRYLKANSDKGLLYKSNGDIENLEVYSDSDFANDETRRSTTGYVCIFNNAPVAWCSRRQPIIAMSSTEAEFISAADSMKEVLYLRSLINELLGITPKVLLHVDNTSAICIIKNGTFSRRSKHVDLRYAFIHDAYQNKIFEIVHCPSKEQLADPLTKPLVPVKFKELIDKILT